MITVKPVFRGHLRDKEKSDLIRQVRWSLERGSIIMKFSRTGQEKGDLLIQVTSWRCLNVIFNGIYLENV